MVPYDLFSPLPRYPSLPSPVICLVSLLFLTVLTGVALYLGVAYITHHTQGFYVYNFLDPSTEHAKLAAYIIGILAAALIIFAIVNVVKILLGRWTTPEVRDAWRERYETRRRADSLERDKRTDSQ